METVTPIIRVLDNMLIFFFRWPDIPIVGYYVGCMVLASICVLMGQATIAAAFFWNQKFIDRDNRQMVHMHNLSIRALMVKDKKAYKNCNKAANEAFGKVFFAQIALSISSLWPIPFAAGWLQMRFEDVVFALPLKLPLIGDHVGFMFSFLPIYILVYILFNQIKGHLPVFRTIVKRLEHYDVENDEPLLRVSNLVEPDQGPTPVL